MTIDNIKIELDTGTTLYFDYIEAFTTNSVLYAGNYIDSTPEKIAMLKLKKDEYELLKLNTSKNELRRLVAEQSNEIIKNVFSEILDTGLKDLRDILNELKNNMSNFNKEHNNAIIETNKLSIAQKHLNSEIDKIKTSDALNSVKKSYELSIDKLQSTTEKINEVIETAGHKLRFAENEFNDLNSKLKSLFIG